MMALDQIRREYLQGGLRREELPDDPLLLFETWQKQAIACGLPDPTAMVANEVPVDEGLDQLAESVNRQLRQAGI